MQKLRQLYAETQNNAKVNFDKVTLERCKKILAYANREYDSMIAQGDYTHIEEISFYQEKYRQLIEKFNSAINDKTKKSKLQADVQAITVQNYGSTAVRAQAPLKEGVNSGTARFGGESAPPSGTPQFYPQKNSFLKREGESGMRGDPKELMNSYFETKKNQIEHSMIGFKSVLDGMPKPSQKYAIRSKVQQKNENNEEISKLNGQISELGKKLQESKMVSDFNHGLYQVQKNEYEVRIRDLVDQVDRLNRQNEKLKQQSVGFQHMPSPQENMQSNEVFDPRVNKYRENNIYKLKNKYFGQNAEKDILKPVLSGGSVGSRMPMERKTSEQQILFKAFSDPHNKYDVQFQKSNLKFNKSEADSQEKNIAVRSKLSFFKPSVVLYRGEQFEVAIKSDDVQFQQSRKVTIFVNNKDKFQRKVSIAYTVDANYYQVKVNKKLTEVDGLRQGKQEIEVVLKNKNDLDSMIEAKLIMNNKTINFLIPTMFIEFMASKSSGKRFQSYEKNVVVPIYQFSNIFSAMEMIPLEKEYQDRIEKGSVFARSKYHEGLINLRWKGRRELQIQTIKPWVLFMSYLMYKEY